MSAIKKLGLALGVAITSVGGLKAKAFSSSQPLYDEHVLEMSATLTKAELDSLMVVLKAKEDSLKAREKRIGIIADSVNQANPGLAFWTPASMLVGPDSLNIIWKTPYPENLSLQGEVPYFGDPGSIVKILLDNVLGSSGGTEKNPYLMVYLKGKYRDTAIALFGINATTELEKALSEALNQANGKGYLDARYVYMILKVMKTAEGWNTKGMEEFREGYEDFYSAMFQLIVMQRECNYLQGTVRQAISELNWLINNLENPDVPWSVKEGHWERAEQLLSVLGMRWE